MRGNEDPVPEGTEAEITARTELITESYRRRQFEQSLSPYPRQTNP